MNKYRFHFKNLKTKKKKTKKTKGFPIKIARGLQREREIKSCVKTQYATQVRFFKD